MRFLFVFLFVAASLSVAFAADDQLESQDTKPTCFEQIVTGENWLVRDEKVLTCVPSQESYKKGAKYLCNKDGSDVSAPYAKYLAYMAARKAAFAEFETAKRGELALAHLKLTRIEQDWSLTGLSNSIADALNEVAHAEYKCRSVNY